MLVCKKNSRYRRTVLLQGRGEKKLFLKTEKSMALLDIGFSEQYRVLI
jgi:hypothetical protein